jgi:lysophospholipase L1-like esterase
MLANLFKIICIIIVLFLALAGFQAFQIFFYTKKFSYNMKPFQKINPESKYKVLFAGDSTCVGTGASDNSLSTAGWFSRDFPQASIENHSQNGLRLKGMIGILSQLKGKHYNLAVLQIGANDIMNLTSFKDIERDEHEALQLAKQISEKVIILHSGDIGKAPLFHWPFTWIYTWRTLKVREIYKKSQDERASYVDIYQLEKSIKNKQNNYSPDRLHLNGQGYHTWYSFIKIKL